MLSLFSLSKNLVNIQFILLFITFFEKFYKIIEKIIKPTKIEAIDAVKVPNIGAYLTEAFDKKLQEDLEALQHISA